MKGLFTSECVSIGHPDKMVDYCLNSILTELCKKDPNSRAGLEALASRDSFILGGEVKTKADIDYAAIVRKAIKTVGYDGVDGFSYDTLNFQNKIAKQSPDISQGVDREDGRIGAGDIGIMFGYAVKETPVLMPLTIYIAQKLLVKHQLFQKSRTNDFYPDAKSQVTYDYDNNKIHTIVMSVSHAEHMSYEDICGIIENEVIAPVLKEVKKECPYIKDSLPKIIINGTGKFVVCGPASDFGTAGRKLVVDMYGGRGHIGGGNPHGKDGSKVDNSAARYLRHVAKNLVAADVADEVEIQISYCIGLEEPISLSVNTFGTNKTKYSDEELASILADNYDFTPKEMIKTLNLTKVDYSLSSFYGMFGHEPGHKDFPWEELNLVDYFKKLFLF